jgi:hypothetical protein
VKGRPYLLSVIFRMLMFYAIMWPVFLYSVFVYGSIILHIRRIAGKTTGGDAEASKRIMSTIGRLACFPAILIISITFGSTNRVYQFIYLRDPPFWVYETHVGLLALVSPSHLYRTRGTATVSRDPCRCEVMQQGVMNTIAYGFNPQVKRELRKVRRPIKRSLPSSHMRSCRRPILA